MIKKETEGNDSELLLHWCFYYDADDDAANDDDGDSKDSEDIFDDGAGCVNENIRDYC